MTSLQISILPSLSSSSSHKRFHAYAAINAPKFARLRISLPKVPTPSTRQVQVFNGPLQAVVPSEKDVNSTSQTFRESCDPSKSKAIIQQYDILKAVADSVEMHKNIAQQRNNWMLLTNMMMVRLNTAIHSSALKLTSILLSTASKAMLVIKNKIQTSKRKATRLSKKLHGDMQTTLLTHTNPTDEKGVSSAMKTSKFEPRTNDVYQMKVFKSQKKITKNNGWSPELEKEMREILEVVKRKDMEECERRGNFALRINKTLAILGPLLAAIAALGSALERHGSSWAGIVAVVAGSSVDFMNALQGIVLDMYRNCGCLLQGTIEATLEEKDCEKRENGELFEMKVAMKLGRSVSQLRQLACKFAASDSEGIAVDEIPESSSN